MSLLAVVEEAIRLCKAEQTKINEDIQLYRQMLKSLRPCNHIRHDIKDSELADDKEQDILPEEEEEMKLLERALEKAQRIRSSVRPSEEPRGANRQSGPRKSSGDAVTKPKVGIPLPGTLKSNQTANKVTRSAGFDRKGSDNRTTPRPSTVGVKGSAGPRPGQHKASVQGKLTQKCPVLSAKVLPPHSASKVNRDTISTHHPDRGQSHTSITHSKYEAIQSSLRTGRDSREVAATSVIPQKEPVCVSHTKAPGTDFSPPQSGIASEQIAKWKSLRSKENRLWDKVIATQREPVPGRNHFMERMRTTFPEGWPRGSPNHTRALMDRLTRQGEEISHHYQTQLLLSHQASAAGKQPGSKEKEESEHILGDLRMMALEVQKQAGLVKQEWEAWDRWRPEGGCLCPVGVKGEWGDATASPLPRTVTYTTEAQLLELETLRMQVVLLQQETLLQQALSNSLSPQLSSILSDGGRPNPGVIRDVYSLLAEGGERSPALVLNAEPD